MSLFDENLPRKPKGPIPGADLADLSIEEIEEWIIVYRNEIARLEQALEAKRRGRSAADSVFRL